MGNTLARIRKRLKGTIRSWKADCHFSLRYALLRIPDEIGGRLGLKKISDWAYNKRNQYILSYLSSELNPVFKKYVNSDNAGVKQENAPIWVCWWTGEETASPLVKQCIRSIRANSGEHPVIFISEANYWKYIDIPHFILDRMQKKQMGLAHFSDYLRVSLLSEYGGLWLDATIFCSQTVPEIFFSLPVTTCKSKYAESRYLSHYQWVTFCLGGWKGNIFFSYLKDAFEKYWSDNEVAIDYLFFDYLIYLGREKVSAINKFLDDIPYNTPHRDDLQAAMNEALSASMLWRIIQDDTEIYKLSWRETYSEVTADGADSIYRAFLALDF